MRSGNKIGSGWLGSLLAGRGKKRDATAARAPAKRPPRRKAALSGRVERPRAARILIIDDEPKVAVALKRLLHRHDVVTAHTGTEARALIAEQQFDVVISDVMMPEPSGIDVYLELAAQSSPLVARFIFVTGGVHGSKAHKFLASVDNPRLDKPVDALELEHAIARAMNGGEAGNVGAG